MTKHELANHIAVAIGQIEREHTRKDGTMAWKIAKRVNIAYDLIVKLGSGLDDKEQIIKALREPDFYQLNVIAQKLTKEELTHD